MNELNLSSYKLPGKAINFQEKHFRNRMFNNRTQGPRSKFLSERWGGGGRGELKKNAWMKFGGEGVAWQIYIS